MQKLVELLNMANAAYYNSGKPIMTDAEYDALFEKLQKMEEETGVVLPDSPTLRVGSEVLDKIPRVSIEPIPMLSLKKIHTDEELEAFKDGLPVVGMIKCDGLSIRLTYKDGKLVQANTRGSGEMGGLITSHAKRFLNIPLTIDKEGTFIVDGEAIIKLNDFQEVLKTETLQNPRNAASGALNSLDLQVVKNRRLSFIAWDVIAGGTDDFIESLEIARSLGFEVVYYSTEATNADIMDKAKELNIPCDGVVWKFIDKTYGEGRGRTAKFFNNAVAWKPAHDIYESRLIRIEYQLGRTGKITPIAVFEPVEIEGSTITKSSMTNISVYQETLDGNGWPGQRIGVSKRNLIIPKIEWSEEDDPTQPHFELIKVCPICNKSVDFVQGSECVEAVCNNPDCAGKFINTLKHFCSNTGLNIKGLSGATLEKLVDWGWVESFGDIFTLSAHKEEWAKMPSFGPTSVHRILNAIEEATHCEPAAFLSAIGVPGIGLNYAKKLIDYFGSWNGFIEAVEQKFPFYQLPNLGRELSQKISDFDYSEARYVAHNFLTFKEKNDKIYTETLKGKRICVTGKLTKFKNRGQLQEYIEEHGGKVVSAVSARTSILINNDKDSSSTKNIDAKKFDIPILTEEEFLARAEKNI